jgi:hypothetical protein
MTALIIFSFKNILEIMLLSLFYLLSEVGVKKGIHNSLQPEIQYHGIAV